ncbi:MAG: type II toxin-antitoxin system Phd/YefM family antitoxin [Planctomycetes bacterium]|nr:type II toxin-antitoxin system Phd/YefM family antitoxin [Planctomycetota bacterium]
MSRSYSIAEARGNLAAILAEVECGGAVGITRRGKPVAVVLSAAAYERMSRSGLAFGEAYRAWRERHDPEDLDLGREFFASLRDRSMGREVRT